MEDLGSTEGSRVVSVNAVSDATGGSIWDSAEKERSMHLALGEFGNAREEAGRRKRAERSWETCRVNSDASSD